MSEYLSKKAVLEWLDREKEEDYREWEIERVGAYLNVIKEIQSGAFDADESEGTWKATAEVLGRENAQMNSEIQRLRAALEHILEYWNRDENEQAMSDALWTIIEIAEEALSEAREDLSGEFSDERCPKCGANLLGNKVGDKWCSLAGCDYSMEKGAEG